MHRKKQQRDLWKLTQGRKKWKDRSHKYQREKRTLQDRIRYFKCRLQERDEQLKRQEESILELKKLHILQPHLLLP